MAYVSAWNTMTWSSRVRKLIRVRKVIAVVKVINVVNRTKCESVEN